MISIQQYIKYLFPSQSTLDIVSYILMGISCVCWVIGFIYSNQHNLNGTQTCISRYTVQVVLSYIYSRQISSPWNMSNKHAVLKLMFRSVILITHSFIVSLVQFYLPQNIYHVIGCTAPIFTFITNYLFNGIKATKIQMIGVGLTFFGLVCVINGEVIYSMIDVDYQFQTEFKNYKTTNIYFQLIVAVLYLGWTFVWSIALIFTKIAEYNSAEMLTTSSAIGVGLYGFIYNFHQQKTSPEVYFPSWLWVGVPITLYTYLFTVAIKITSNAGKISTLIVVNAVVGYFLSVFRYGQRVNALALTGTVIIIISVFIVLVSKNQDKKENKNSKEMIIKEIINNYENKLIQIQK